MSHFGSIPSMMVSNSTIAPSYIFDASAQTVEILDDDVVACVLIINATDGMVIFNPANPATTGSIEDQLVTLTFDTTSMSDADDLLVFCEKQAVDDTRRITTLLELLLLEYRLLNARFEETFSTHLDKQDI